MADGTATVGEDYRENSGSITFAPGQTARTLDVETYGDVIDEPDETFTVNALGPDQRDDRGQQRHGDDH